MKKPSLILLLIGALLCTVQAQSTWSTQVLLQSALGKIEARTPSNSVLFTFEKNYPPAQFPATYIATTPINGVLPLQVQSTVSGTWNVLLEIADLRDGNGRLLVPARQIMVRVNNGLWLRGNGAAQIIYTDRGATRTWKDIKLEFAIELLGNEIAGEYAVQTYFSALALP